MLELFREAEREGCGAGVIGCFYDGGLREAREALTMPVVGMGEASDVPRRHLWATASRSSSGVASGYPR